jgi:hypothetical protein
VYITHKQGGGASLRVRKVKGRFVGECIEL